MRNSLHKSVLITFLTLLCLGVSDQMFSQINGDFKSRQSGPWGFPGTWMRYNGTVWENPGAGVIPGASSSVYIQTGHTVTVDAPQACNDIHLSTAAGARLQLNANTLSVYGKMRAYIGAVDELPGTSTSTLSANSTWITSTLGKFVIAGNSRVLTAVGEWGSGNAANVSPTGVDFVVNLNAGQVVTVNTDIKARSFTISEGTIKIAGGHRLIPDQGITGGNFTIESGGVVESDASGTGNNTVIGRNTTAMGVLDINAGGTLRVSGAAPTIGMATITNNGTIEYTGSGNQSMIVATNSGAAMPTYTNLVLSGGGIKSMSSPLTVTGTLAIADNTTLNNTGFDIVLSSASNYDIAGIISGAGSINKTGVSTTTFSSGSGNNTNHTYTGGTIISSGTIDVTGLSGISVAAMGSTSQSITFSGTSPAIGTYKVFPGSLTVTTENFTHNADSSVKVTFDFTTSSITVAEATIVTAAISPSGYCVGANVIVGFTTDVPVAGTYVVQLSDAFGSFATPVIIGNGASSPISALLPGAAVSGTGYRIRVINTTTGTIGTDNGSNLSISGTIVASVNTTDVNCPTVSDGTATVNIISGGVAPYTYNWVGYNPGLLQGQGGWDGGMVATFGTSGNSNVVSTISHSGSHSWHYRKGIQSPGSATPFTQPVASVGAPGTGALGDQVIIEFAFKSATPNDGSNMNVHEAAVTRDDRTGSNVFLRNVAGGLVEIYLNKAIQEAPYYQEEVLGTVAAGEWHTIKLITNYPETDSADHTTWGSTQYFVDGVDFGTRTSWAHWWRINSTNNYTVGSGLKFSQNGAGDGFYIDDISVIVNNTLTSQTVGSFSAGFEPVSGSGDSITGLVAGAYQVNVTDANGCSASASGMVGTTDGPVHNENRDTYFCSIQDAVNDALTADGDIIRVGSGTYAGNITVSKSVTILGPNAGIDPNSGVRVAEAILVPGTISTTGGVMSVTANNVIVDGFSFNGDNTLLSSGWTGTNSADIDAANAIGIYTPNVNGLVVKNNVIENFAYFGVNLYGSAISEANTAKTGHVINSNLIRNMGHYGAGNANDNWGGGVILYNSHYANISNNVMLNVRTGIQTGNFQAANTGGSQFNEIIGNTIQARFQGIFYNLHRHSPWTISNNTITGLANATETTVATRPWRGMLMSSLGGPSMGNSIISGNTIDGSAISRAKDGMSVWGVHTNSSVHISGGSITGVNDGINVNNYEGYNSNAGDNTAAVIDGVNISGVSGHGVIINDNPLNTNGKTVTAEVKNTTISAPIAIFISGADAGGNVHNNTFNSAAVGINVTGSAISAANPLIVKDNDITLAAQLAGSVPTAGITLTNISGTQAAGIEGNDISGPYYGYLAYNVNSTPVTQITGGTVSGIMQGLALVNIDPVTGTIFSPSTLDIDGVSFSDFSGDHPSQVGRNAHAGIYVYTGGANTNAKITSNIANVTVTGTGNISADSAGLSFADFSTGTGTRQDISVLSSTINVNANRGINVRGGNALVDIGTSTITGNGINPIGSDGNHGFGIVARANAVVNVNNNFISNPATTTLPVVAILSDGATITASQNNFDNNGNANGKLVHSSSSHVAATCNAWGTDCGNIASLVTGNVTYLPFIADSTESDPAAGFQPTGSCDGNIATLGATFASAPAVCDGSEASIALSGLTNGTNIITFEIDGVSASQSVEVTDGTASVGTAVYAAGVHEVTIISSNIGGCDTVFSSNNTATFTVNENPTLGTASSPATCVGNPVSIVFTGLRPNMSGTITISNGTLENPLSVTADALGHVTLTEPSAVAEMNGVVFNVVKVTDSATNCEVVFALGEKTFTFEVNPSLSNSYPTTPFIFTEGTAISAISPVSSTGLGVVYSATLPAGLTIDSATGVIAGTPVAPTIVNTYAVTATNDCGTVSQNITMTVTAIPFAGGGCALVDEDFDSTPQLANTNVNGAWYPDRYRPAGFVSNGSQLVMTISGADGAQLRPVNRKTQFYNTHGRKINQCSSCVAIAKAQLFIPADWATNMRRADLWATAKDASNAISFYPIIGFRNVTGSNPQMSIWNGLGWSDLGAPAAYDTSYSLEIRLNGSNLEYLINDAVVGSFDSGGSAYFADVMLQGYNFNDNTLGTSYDASANNTYDIIWDNVSTGSVSGNVVTNTTTDDSFCSIQGAINDVTTLAGHTLEIGAGSYSEQVLVNKALTIRGNDTTMPVINYLGTATGKPALMDVSVDGVTIEKIHFNVDQTNLRSAIIASASGLDNITIKDNVIDAYGTLGGSYGDRNAVNVNYGSYRVASGGVNNISFTGNTVNGANRFRAGIAVDEGGLTVTGNTISSINHDVQLRFSSNGASSIENNDFNGGGVELAEQNAGASSITVSGNTFTGVGAPGAALLRLRNNQQSTSYQVSGNTFNAFDWAVSLENLNTVILDGNTFTGPNASSRAVVVNTKSISSNSNTIVQTVNNASFINNNFGGSGIAMTFQNHDSDNATFGTYTIGASGNENTFASTLTDFIRLDDQVGASNTAVFPAYPGNISATTMACWTQNIDIQNNNFDLGAGMQSPFAMDNDDRVVLEAKLFNKPDAACTGILVYYQPVTNVTQNTKYISITDAITAANANDVITVADGIYAENIIVSKPLTILGPNANIDECSGSRVAEAILTTAVSDINGTSAYAVVDIQASDVTIKGFTVDGDNTMITTGKSSTTAADIDIAVGMTRYVTGNNTVITNNIFRNLSYFGVELYDYPAAVPSSGNIVSNNKFEDLGTYDTSVTLASYGGGVLLYNNQYATVTNNCMTNVRIGVQTGNFSKANPGVAATIANNTIEARRMGVFHNLQYGALTSPIAVDENTITALSSPNETRWYGISLSSLQVPGPGAVVTGNIIDGSAATAANVDGINVWNSQADATITDGTITGVMHGVNVNNFEGYASNAGGNTKAIIQNVTITGATVAGVFVHDNVLNTNNKFVSAEVRNTTISGSPTGILVRGADSGANIHDNTLSVTVKGVEVTGSVVSATNMLTIQDNQVTFADQLSAGNPTVGISLTDVSGSASATAVDNTISGSYYGYLVYDVNTSPSTSISGGSISGVMQGLSIVNVNPANNTELASSTIDVDGITMSGFTGNHPAVTGKNFHAGIYVYTAGTNAAEKVTATIENVNISGTGKISQDSAGMSFADFSTGAGTRQEISILSSDISNNVNRGINARGVNANIDIATSNFEGNGNDPFGGSNHGYAVLGRLSAVLNIHNNFFVNPQTSTLTVTAIASDNAVITASENNLDNNNNANGRLITASIGSPVVNASCNTWGADCLEIASMLEGPVTYQPFISIINGNDADGGAAGFQPAADACSGAIATLEGVAATATDLCEGTSQNVNLSGLTNGLTTINYTVNGGTTISIQGVPVTDGTASFAADFGPGIYEIMITSLNIGGCETPFTQDNAVTFTVKPNPTLSGVTASASEVCEGTEVSFAATGLLAGATDFTYTVDGDQYSASANVAGGENVFAAAVYAVGNHTIAITSATLNGCTTTFNTNNTVSFTVNPLPTLAAITAATVCEGNSTDIVFTGLIPNTSGVATFTYNGGAPEIQAFTSDVNGTFAFPTLPLSMEDHNAVLEITQIVLDDTDCARVFTGKTVTLQVQPNANAGDDGAISVCDGVTPTEGQLFAALGGSPDATGTWSNVGLVYTYTVNATSPCVATDTATVTVTVNPLPAPVITGGNILTCAEPTSVLDAGSYASYVWSTGATTQTITTAANTSAVYSVTVTDNNGCSSSASFAVTYYPVTNETNNTHHATIAAAITAATANDVINVCKGTYENASVDMSSKALTVKGPNFGINGKATRNAEAYLINPIFKMAGSHANTLDGFYVKRTDNVNVNINLSGTGLKNVKNNIFERSAATGGALGLGIEIAGSAGAKNIIGNYFWSTTTTTSGGNHKTWNSGIYLNGGGTGMVTIQDNYFYRNRTAINIDNMSLNHAAVGNTFDTNGTHVALGGGTGGSFVWGDNNFNSMNGMFNLSNVAESFRLDISAGRQSNVYFSDLTDAQLFQVEGRMGGHKETTSGKRGKIIYRANNQYVRSNDNIQNAVKYADAGDIINLQATTYNQKVDIDKSDITIQGVTTDRSLYILRGASQTSGSNGINIQNGKKNVSIKNLTITGFIGGDGNVVADIRANGGNDGLNIDNVAATSARTASGIFINGLGAIDNVTVNNCLVSNHGAGARGIVIWNGHKTNIRLTNNTVTNNNCCGIELSDGTASGVTISDNTVSIGTGDNAIGVIGLDTSAGPNTINGNIITGGGRFGIELKNVDGATVTNNTVNMTTANADLRDRAGIAVMRRAYLAEDTNGVNVPNNVTITGNIVSGYTQSSDSDGYGIVVEGTNHVVTGNTVSNSDIGIQQQAGNGPYTGQGSDDGDQNNKVDNYFGRGNSPVLCNVDVSGNTYANNGTDERIVTGGGTGTIVNTVTPTLDQPIDLVHCAGDLSETVFTGNALPGVIYNWVNDNTDTGLAASGSGTISFTAANLTAVDQVSTVTVTPVANGCEGTPQVFTITINPTKPASVSIATVETENCDGTSVTFVSTSTNGGDAPTYQWMINGNDVTDATDATFTISTLVDGDVVSVEMTSNLTPCLVQSPAVSNNITMTVIAKTVPTFTAVPSICEGDFLAELPATSTNGIAGTWSPEIDNTVTTTYTFTPEASLCATTTTLTIDVSPLQTPEFTQVASICTGGVLNALPITSNNGITGTWSPALNNMATTTYVFTPGAGQCGTSALMTIEVNPILTPVFDQVIPTCQLDPLAELPTTSINGISGTWSPAINNLVTTTYTFTPDPSFCAVQTTMTIQIIPVAIPQFAQVASIYAGDVLNPLPTTSTDGVQGTWSPALNNMETTVYAFTPFEGQCATTAIMMIEVIPNDSSIATGDFRTRTSGSWSVPSTWERYNGHVWEEVGEGSNTGLLPTAENSVYIQTGNIVTLTANSACKDLHMNAASGLRLALGTFTLNVNGKLRAFTGAFNDVPGTSTASLPTNAGWITSTTGKLSIVGDSRELTAVGEWGSGNAGTSSPSGFNFELNLNAGQTVTANTGIKARGFNIAAGTIKVAGNNRLAPDSGSAAGSFTIQSGAVVESDASGTGAMAVIGRSASAVGGTLTINAGGTLRLTGAAPTIGMTSIINNGTVAYTASGDQSLVTAINAGAGMSSYKNVILSGGGTKSMAITTTVTGNITLDADTTLDNGGMSLAIISDLDNTIAGVISGSGDLVQYGAGVITMSAANGNNTAHTYSGQTTVSSNGYIITGLNEITSMSISSAAQNVVFDSATPANGTYQVLPGAVIVGTQNFSSSPATPTKLVTFDYNNSTITVADATIGTSVITPDTYCAGDTVEVAFTSNVVLDGTYTAQLSDASGDFTAAIAIGSSATSPITATLPQGMDAGSGYRIRVVSSHAIIGAENGSDITVNSATVPAFTQVVPQCTGAAIAELPTTSENGITGSWSPAINNTATTTYTFTPDAGQCAAPTTMTITVGVCESIVNLKLFVQGYYTGNGEMASVKYNQDEVSPQDEVENLTIELRDATSKALVASTQATLYTDGTLTSIFSSAPTGMFYIVVKGKNLVQTWSATPQAIGFVPLDYDFSAAESQAYTDGSQPSVVEVETGVWAMFSGDVDQDEIVDPMDVSAISNASDAGQYGVIVTDLNGDGMVDSFDFSLVSNNSDAVIYTQRP